MQLLMQGGDVRRCNSTRQTRRRQWPEAGRRRSPVHRFSLISFGISEISTDLPRFRSISKKSFSKFSNSNSNRFSTDISDFCENH
jgi:hypothetical protein